MTMQRGQRVEVLTAGGGREAMRALGEPVMGRDFMVVWVCTEQAWSSRLGENDGDLNGAIPWPIEDVSELAPA